MTRRPSDADDLSVTHDELAPVDVRPRIDTADLAAVDAEGWEWSRSLKAEVAELRTIVETLTRRSAILWRALGAIGGVAVTAAGIAIKLVYSSGEAAGAGAARDRMIADDHARLEQLGREVARNRGLLDALVPNGVLRLYGPPVNPDTRPPP